MTSRDQPARCVESLLITFATLATATYVARRAGIFAFVCAIQAHLPMMWGQLVVLPAGSMNDVSGR